MRIVHTFIKYPPAVGGHERYVQDLAEGLRARGFDAQVLTSTLSVHAATGRRRRGRFARWLHRVQGKAPTATDDGYEFLDGPYAHVNGVPVTRIAPEVPVSRRVVLPEFKQTLRALKPDLIHAHDIWCAPFEESLEVAQELGVPVFLNPVYHDRSQERHGARWMERLQVTASKVPPQARVFFNTRWEEEALAAAGVRFANTDLLPPSLDMSEFERTPQQPVPGVPAGKLLVSFVGRLNAAKGVDLLIPAFARAVAQLRSAGDPLADRVHLAIAGFQDSANDYHALATSHGLGSQATILTNPTRSQIINLMRASRIFAFPSHCETFGIVVLEAWATENLVMVSDHWALPYVVNNGVNGLVCTDEAWPAQLIAAMRGIDTEWGQTLVRNGSQHLRQHHLRAARIDYLAARIEEVAAARPRSAAS